MPVLRVSCPSGHTASIVEILRGAGMASDVVVVPRHATHDAGDLILAEVERSGVDPFLLVLRRVHDSDEIHVSLQDAERLVPAPEVGPLVDDQVIWAKVNRDIRDSSRLSVVNLLLVTLAGIIAAVGIIQDQLLYIVGAMAISPDYLLVSEVNLAIVRRDVLRFRGGMFALLSAFGMAAVGSYFFAAGLRAFDLVSAQSLATRQVTTFISDPDGLTAFVAIAAGIAGALAITLPDARGLVGVFVSITTIPAAANIGVAAEEAAWSEVAGAATQLGLNLLCLITAGAATLELRRRLAAHLIIRPRVDRAMRRLED